jgi:formylmethanofuran dehydrogenase subunit E
LTIRPGAVLLKTGHARQPSHRRFEAAPRCPRFTYFNNHPIESREGPAQEFASLNRDRFGRLRLIYEETVTGGAKMGAQSMEQYPPVLRKAVEFHGHICPGLLIGYRAAQAAQSFLGADRAEDEDLVAVVENDACSVDAFQVLLGCTFGKGNLIYRDYGKQVYTVFDRAANKAVRVSLKSDVLERPPEMEPLFEKARKNEASAEELKILDGYREKTMERLLDMDTDALFKIEEVPPDVPEKARIFKSVTCHFCGEKVMEPRARVRDGKVACIPCSEVYTRGW